MLFRLLRRGGDERDENSLTNKNRGSVVSGDP
jgi:hypothetical protein